ncbi:putative chitinase [Microvirga flocculans]|uniref:Putative chitinase n=1 Tax=Microvirga flocculans TaxID=217168 RepID=A0A7W6ICU4_9HYPH|nr:hypothetical protein [Microvirga flocculans]MBB4039113.1 putative chitinase [Microvirga flocculans]
MKITYNRDRFFAAIKPIYGKFTQDQVDGLNYLLDAWETHYPNGSLKFLAYCLATAYHETNTTMQPVIEAYWLSEGWRQRNLRYYPFYGRGYVQLTWDYNYEKAQKRLKELFGIEVDLVKSPAKACDPYLAALILYVGCTEGWFTGKKLVDYFAGDKADPINARRIVNGTDEAKKIAGHYHTFVKALLASEEKRESKPLPVETPQTPKVESPKVIVPEEIAQNKEKTDTEPKQASILSLFFKLFGVG